MDYQEEQVQELEVLESIYPDELTINKGTYPGINFEVLLKLELDSDVLAASLTKQHSMLISFYLPEKYPDEAPTIKIQPQEVLLKDLHNDSDEDADEEGDETYGEDAPEFDDHGNRILNKLENLPDKISFQQYIPDLQVKLEEQIEDDMLIGMQMCFALISSIKEHCETWFSEQLHELDRQHELEIQKREKEEQAKFNGTKVTKDSFIEWRLKFRKELQLDTRDEMRRLQAHHGRLTGKQMFEQGVDGTIDDLDENFEDESSISINDQVAKVTDDLKEL
ncbi:hypothetical protein NCAS_0B03650 [Naumovozyma castellii]|uniref:RWD domain-containing protein n=1 Tax=Naumovozyma castellii TaxID=27288 RepID=G0VBX2_NAUCA|nr:hypothetical protein NCAS_0B03650 [Naumovozyma castellii CBS 4309]CCC68449.1 hypothetical protein NCAS_0B03650 [Naumovozyma castellii CBS 4309]